MTLYSVDNIIRDLRQHNGWYRAGGVQDAQDAQDTGEQQKQLPGVNLCGYLRDESGWGAAGRGYVRALRHIGAPLSMLDLSALSSNRSHDDTVGVSDDARLHDINLVCVDAGQHFSVMSHVGEHFFEGRYNVGAWAWELPRFPLKWYDRLAYYDEIWVTTSFVASSLAPISPVPVVVVPPVLTPTATGSREAGRRGLGVGPDEFVFLFVFDFHSHMARKNPLAVIEAFKQAFLPGEAVRLVIKCVNGEADPAGYAQMLAAAEGYPITIYNGYWSASDVRDLMAACDSYVSLHRSEGTGLTITDAMAQGKPVIATGWSGNMDFMSVANSYPVRYRLVEIEEGVGPYREGETWAEPSVEHAASLMRHVFSDRADSLAIGEAAKRDIYARFSEQAVGDLIRQRLEVISNRQRFPELKQEIGTFFNGYRDLTAQIHDVLYRLTPQGSNVAFVSKGDNALVALDGRQGWHFPQTEQGIYAGYHPADSAEAIAHIERLRAKGAEFLVFPGTAFWWLEHYADFAAHLDANYERVWDDERCIVFALKGGEA